MFDCQAIIILVVSCITMMVLVSGFHYQAIIIVVIIGLCCSKPNMYWYLLKFVFWFYQFKSFMYCDSKL